jgi:hypothetical protein
MKPNATAYIKATLLSLLLCLAIGGIIHYFFDMALYQFLVFGAVMIPYLSYQKQKNAIISKQ